MAELFGGLQRGLGAIIGGIYEVIPSYGIAIVLLTVVVRTLLIPLTVKQIRSMTAMQKLQPEMKKIQQKYKQLQQKAADKAEVQQIRLKMNEETMALYKQHGVHPAGGCLPILAQAPAFIALYSVLRASIIVAPTTVMLLPVGAQLKADLYTDVQLKSMICRPADEGGKVVPPQPSGPSPTHVVCTAEGAENKTFKVGEFVDRNRSPEPNAGWVNICRPSSAWTKQKKPGSFVCQSALGSGHLPRDGDLFVDITSDKAEFLGMHLGCSPQQAASEKRIRECTTSSTDGGGANVIPYYLFIGLIVATQFYQGKQMSARAATQSPQAAQQQAIMKFMPILIGIFALNLPAGVNVYFLASNVWTIGQQAFVYRKREQAETLLSGNGSTPASKSMESEKIVEAREVETPKDDAERKPSRHTSKKKGKKKR